MWQPIETAPQDGSWVLLCGGRWACDNDWLPPVAVAQWEGQGFCAYWSAAVPDQDAAYDSPTHWMPLPPPPEGA